MNEKTAEGILIDIKNVYNRYLIEPKKCQQEFSK
jgi:hypothetical protein